MTFDQKNLAIGPMYLCHGAEGEFAHTFKIEGVIDSPWLDQHVSINHAPGFSSAVVADPRYGELQEFPSMGAKWQLSCPGDGKDADFEYWVKSEFTAEPYSIPVRLGDYRRKILSSRAPISAPIINDEVVAEVTIGSFYTDKKLEGVEVQWWVDGEFVRLELTSSLGVSSFSHIFSVVGRHQVIGKIHSPYNGTTQETEFSVNVYEDSPWKQAKLFVNDNEVPWSEPIALRRGQSNDLRVEALSNIGAELKLLLVNDEGLVIGSDPEFNTWVPGSTGSVTWAITLGSNKSGRISLVVESEDVERPWELPCWVISSDLASEVDIQIDGNPVSSDAGWFYRGQSRTITAIPKPGSPLAGYPIMLTCAIKSGLDPANVVSVPEFDAEQTVHSWIVTGLNKSGTFELGLLAKNIATGITLPISKLLSTSLADEADIKISGEAVPADGNWFFRDKPQTITLTPKPDSPLAGYPVTLTCTIESGLDTTNVMSVPKFDEKQVVHSWNVTGSTKSGTFRLRLVGEGIPTGITLPVSKLLSDNLADEVKLLIDGVEIPNNGTDFLAGIIRTLTLSYTNANLLVGVPLALDWVPGLSLSYDDFGSQPLFQAPVTKHEWKLTGAEKEGNFKFKLTSGASAASLVTSNNRLIRAYKLVCGMMLQGEFIELPPPPIMVIVMPGIYIRHVRLLKSDNSPVVGAPVTFSSPVHQDFTSETNENGIALGTIALGLGMLEISATTTLDGKIYAAKLLLDVKV